MNRLLAGLAALCLVGAAHAQMALTPSSAPYSQFITDFGSEDGSEAVYVNTAPSRLFYAPGLGKSAADDLRLQHGGVVSGFDFAYYDSGPFGQVSATVDFFSANGDSLGAKLAGFQLSGLMVAPGTAFGVRVSLEGTGYEFLAPQDMYMRLSFDRATAGWLVAENPYIGSSDNRFLVGSQNAWFGGTPKGNFYSAIRVTPEPSSIAAFLASFTGLMGIRRRR